MKIKYFLICTFASILSSVTISAFAIDNNPLSLNQEAESSTQRDEEVIQNDSFVYSPQGRRDPFEPLLPEEPVIAEVVKKTRPEKIKGPLEKFELKQFRLMAIMVVGGTPHAMVKAPDGKSYTVKKDDYIGMNGGRVANIQTKVIDIDANGMRVEKSPDRIVIEESGIDSVTGQVVKENRYIAM